MAAQNKQRSDVETGADEAARLHEYDQILNDWYEEVSRDASGDGPDTIGLFGGRAEGSAQYDLSRASRLRRIGGILQIVRRYDIFHGLTPQGLRRMLEELGPTFVKAGQILSMRSEILPQSFTRELSKLRTDVEPMDRETVLASIKKTGHAVVAHEAVKQGGFGAELSATIAEEAFSDLKAPVVRIGAPFVPIPMTPHLEDLCRTLPKDIVAAAKKAVSK